MSKSPPMSSTTLASATTGLAAVTLFALLPDDTLSEFEVEILTFFAYTGSFAGMSAVTRVGSRLRVISAGWASGLFLLGLWPLFPGVGGKFGFSAMLSVLLVERLPSCKIDHSHQGKFDHSHQVADQSRPVARHSLLKASALLSADGISEIPDPQVQLDWLDWVPAHCWSIVESFLRHGGSIEAAKSAVEAHYESRTDVSSEALNSALLSFSSFVDVRILLKACQALEVAINPPPVLYWGDNHSGNVAEDATTQFCLWLFQALRSGLDNQISGLKEDELPINVVKPLLLNLDIPVEALNPVVTAAQFSHRIQKRVLSLHKLMQMKAVVEAGAYQ